ncbi:GTPase [Pararhodobacter sp. SW119]|uniref:GTPase n=1 Tax=Pararhodobacter sp. SW119 TaxID=2780075 RepID=UPI001AE0688F|nr:GTPase [Pararhodobacter sp. SW119]
MRLADRLRMVWLRWNRLGLAGVLILPLGITSILGFLWLAERGWLLWFVLASVLLFAGLRAVRLVLRMRRNRAGFTAAPVREAPAVEADPDWSDTERAAFETARAHIRKRVKEPLTWEDLPAEALAVVETVAREISGGKRTALDFTLPEALLLIDRVALRYRDFLRVNVPFSDQLSVRALYWLWQRQHGVRRAWDTGFLAYRGVRIVLNPAVGLLREVERAVTAGLQERLTDQLVLDSQVIVLEEAAQAAVDLYSGRLRFSDAELAELQLASNARDMAAAAIPDDPVRILVLGQVSAGKSTLINALLGHSAAETDMAPTTDRLTAHDFVLDDTPCRLVDTEGLDGGKETLKSLSAQMVEADLILWVLRANRPGRAPDTALLAQFEARMAEQPARRRPPLILVAAAADALLPGWPYPEGRLPADEADRVGAAMAAIGQDMGGRVVIPVRAEAPDWNVDPVIDALSAAVDEALMVQRNRRRLEGAESWNVRENLGRAGKGLRTGARVFGRRLRDRLR